MQIVHYRRWLRHCLPRSETVFLGVEPDFSNRISAMVAIPVRFNLFIPYDVVLFSPLTTKIKTKAGNRSLIFHGAKIFTKLLKDVRDEHIFMSKGRVFS